MDFLFGKCDRNGNHFEGLNLIYFQAHCRKHITLKVFFWKSFSAHSRKGNHIFFLTEGKLFGRFFHSLFGSLIINISQNRCAKVNDFFKIFAKRKRSEFFLQVRSEFRPLICCESKYYLILSKNIEKVLLFWIFLR